MTDLPSKRIKDMRGRRVGKLMVMSFNYLDNINRNAYWNCQCDCGNQCSVSSGELNRHRANRPKSCGCSQVQSAIETHTFHGMCGSPEHQAWADMKQRCYNPNNREYIRYGQRGIKICERWLSDFSNFLTDIGPRPSNKYSIERKNVNGDYEPANCIWTKNHRQQWNRRDTRIVTFLNQTMSIGELSHQTGVSRHLLKHRIFKLKQTPDQVIGQYFLHKSLEFYNSACDTPALNILPRR